MIQIKEGFEKTFINPKNKSEFDIYHELDEKVNEIALQLEKPGIFNEELDYFLLVAAKYCISFMKTAKTMILDIMASH